jgi:hypothetical protein
LWQRLITIAWSLNDRRRTPYSTLHRWMHLYVGYLLGLVLMGYAVSKVVPSEDVPSSQRKVEDCAR